jgi:site-specific recombinase XerD
MGKEMDKASSDLITGFQGALRREGLAESTRVKYVHHVREFVGELDEEQVLGATRQDGEDYLDRIADAGLGPATVRLRLSTGKSFTYPERGPWFRTTPAVARWEVLSSPRSPG